MQVERCLAIALARVVLPEGPQLRLDKQSYPRAYIPQPLQTQCRTGIESRVITGRIGEHGSHPQIGLEYPRWVIAVKRRIDIPQIVELHETEFAMTGLGVAIHAASGRQS